MQFTNMNPYTYPGSINQLYLSSKLTRHDASDLYSVGTGFKSWSY